ncbi:Metallo-dependent hydrolase [Pluteus cervinus]|uniref:Metallo-dependent hydrolase n=1 Tax=Pluteus cervinus TaxID=181527 RepID=A0ACD3A711_9AGAR|nr:Metallo-dependent hydrolase [Pluteus cervinus]
MGKKKSNTISEDYLLLPQHVFPSRPAPSPSSSVPASGTATPSQPPSTEPSESATLSTPAPESKPTLTPIFDSHTHLLSTYAFYKSKYPSGQHQTVFEFAKALLNGGTEERKSNKVEAMVDVWCEPPFKKDQWKVYADAALTKEGEQSWGGFEYWFVMGIHEAKKYNDQIEADILEAMTHPRCVGWGEIGLDYHYDHSPREIQREVFTRQLRHAVKLGKSLTIHTREADEDTERILKAEVPKDHKVHIHCFTDSPQFAQNLLAHFPNLCIGVTGVVTYSSNTNTSDIIRIMAESNPTAPLRIVLETDAPYMTPGNICGSLPAEVKGKKLPICHSAMIPWTAEFVVGVVGSEKWDVEKVMKESRDNCRMIYGV